MATTVTLRVTAGPFEGQEFEFVGRTFLTVGRSRECLLRLNSDPPDLSLSRRHCLFDIDPPRVSVLDLGSRNGTFVNDQQLGAPGSGDEAALEQELTEEDAVRVGQTCFQVAITERPDAEACVSPWEAVGVGVQ